MKLISPVIIHRLYLPRQKRGTQEKGNEQAITGTSVVFFIVSHNAFPLIAAAIIIILIYPLTCPSGPSVADVSSTP